MTRQLSYAVNAINFLSPLLSADVVGVYTQDYLQVFPSARPLKASIRNISKVMEHPVETGETIVDHQIFLPIEIELPLIIQSFFYREVYQQIKQLYLNNTLLTVQTFADTYTNQLIQELPHEESPDFYNTLIITLRTKEVQFAQALVTETISKPKDKNNSPTKDIGNQQPQTPKASVLLQAKRKIAGK